MINFPVDADGEFIKPGDKLFLQHNKKIVTVRSVEFLEKGWVVWPHGNGGGIGLPEASFDIKHV
jgi:hypothetical protein